MFLIPSCCSRCPPCSHLTCCFFSGAPVWQEFQFLKLRMVCGDPPKPSQPPLYISLVTPHSPPFTSPPLPRPEPLPHRSPHHTLLQVPFAPAGCCVHAVLGIHMLPDRPPGVYFAWHAQANPNPVQPTPNLSHPNPDLVSGSRCSVRTFTPLTLNLTLNLTQVGQCEPLLHRVLQPNQGLSMHSGCLHHGSPQPRTARAPQWPPCQ